jgi:chitin disaccharide deacetylase
MKSLLRFFFLLTLAITQLPIIEAQQPPTKSLAERLGYPANSRLLIIHADDFGMMHSVNRATSEALEHHWITSSSILVPCPWFPEVVQWTKSHPDADLGIHLALNADWTSYRWAPVSPQTKNSSLLDADGFLPLTTEFVVAHAKVPDVETEVHAQVDKAKSAGIPLSHLDTHMGTIVSSPDLFGVYLSAGQSYKLPLLLSRVFDGRDTDLSALHLAPNSIVLDGVLEMMPGVPQSQWLDAYKKMLQSLKPGTYQLIVHLAYNDSEMQAATFDHPDWGAQWRQNDFDLVRNPEFQKFLKDQGFILVSWKDLAKAAPAN